MRNFLNSDFYRALLYNENGILASFAYKVILSSAFFYLQFMKLSTTDATMFCLTCISLAHENSKKHPQKLLIIGPNVCFIRTANQPKTSQDLKLCSIKIAHRATYMNLFAYWCNLVYIN